MAALLRTLIKATDGVNNRPDLCISAAHVQPRSWCSSQEATTEPQAELNQEAQNAEPLFDQELGEAAEEAAEAAVTFADALGEQVFASRHLLSECYLIPIFLLLLMAKGRKALKEMRAPGRILRRQ